jgi:hypothetical protein
MAGPLDASGRGDLAADDGQLSLCRSDDAWDQVALAIR